MQKRKMKMTRGLRYSFGNEDWRTEETALDIQPKDQVLCITASGDRPLNLLARECQKIVCIDANHVQNHLLQLKAAAMLVLEYQEYLAFLGAIPGEERSQTLQLLLPYMDAQASKFWVRHEKMIVKGILYQGTVERLTNIVAKAFALMRGKKVKRLFSMSNLEEQKKFLREEWDSFFFRKLFNLLLHPSIIRLFIEDPGLANVGSDIKPGTYIYDRIHSSLEHELAKKNPLLSLLLCGQVSQEAFSPYLTESGTQTIKTRLSSLEIRTMDVIDYLDTISGPTFDVFSLSDVASYITYPNFIRLLNNIVKTAKPGARFCLRQFLSSYEIPANLQPFFMRDHALEKKLERQDNCFVYRFFVGTIGCNKVSAQRPASVAMNIPLATLEEAEQEAVCQST
jgi:S-adenosylmethionine-diacylglycerol 3-amino-3-carboxypropyl transferase